jgi:hypothetical protein
MRKDDITGRPDAFSNTLVRIGVNVVSARKINTVSDNIGCPNKGYTLLRKLIIARTILTVVAVFDPQYSPFRKVRYCLGSKAIGHHWQLR